MPVTHALPCLSVSRFRPLVLFPSAVWHNSLDAFAYEENQ